MIKMLPEESMISSEMADRENMAAINFVAITQLLIIPFVYSGMMYCSNVKWPVRTEGEFFFFS